MVRVEPGSARARWDVGLIRQRRGDLDGAITSFKEALRLDPKLTAAGDSLAQVERLLGLLPRLPGVLAGTDRPATPAEAIEFGQLCKQPFQGRYAAAVRFSDEAFAADPKLAASLSPSHCYDAACYAARAARGDGVDAPTGPEDRAALRAKALAGLRADLDRHKKRAAAARGWERKELSNVLTLWLGDRDLSALRPGPLRIGLPAAERAEWDVLWAGVQSTLAEAKKPPPPPEVAPPPREVPR